MGSGIAFRVNGAAVEVAPEAGATLLDALRGPLGLTGTRFGCGEGSCGACAVLAGGRPEMACLMPLAAAAGLDIVTVEGLGSPQAPHPVQEAFIAEQAMQCGYCVSGIMIAAAALLARNPSPDEAAIRQALEAHLCRCGAQGRMLRAVARAAGMQQARHG